LISIIIPALNEEKLLPDLLDQLPASLRERHDFEIIVSDGGSGDGTLREAEKRGCRLVIHEAAHRQTIAEGRNTGAAAARGELLVFLNADVRLADPDRFFDAVREVFKDRKVAGATCEVQVFPEEESGMDRAFHVVHNRYVRLLNAIGEGMGRGECQALRRESFEAVGGYNIAMAAGEDFDLFRRLRKTGRIRMLPGVVVYESPRRFRKYGYFRIVRDWTMNALTVMFRHRSSSKSWDAVR
jgi:glycosyltransferase involved in cell wall biosynthesis